MFFPVNGDPYYNNVSLLLPMTGANNSTTFTDVSPSPKSVSVIGNTKISTAQSKWGSSGYFDGNSYLSINSHSGFNFGSEDFTVETWVRLANVNAYSFLIAPSSDSNGYLMIAFNHDGNNGYISLGRAAIGWPVDFWPHGMSNDTWHHIAITRSGSTNRCFVDGNQIGNPVTDSTSWTQTDLLISSHPAGYRITGYLQDLRITKGIARYTANFTPPSAPLVARASDLPVHQAIRQPHAFHQIARVGL